MKSRPPMIGAQRRICEQLFHDRQAAERAAARIALRFDAAAYLDHETWIRPALARLGKLRGQRVLDYGCGHGMAAVLLSQAGARVAAFDLSPGYVNETRERARANGVRVECVAADAEQLPFPDASFDAVWGNAILHHLDLMRAGRELQRILKPGGVAVFCEPWGGNPALAFARRFLPYPNKDRTPDEQPLTRRCLEPLRALFERVHVEGFQLLGMLPRGWRVSGRGPLERILDTLDAGLLRLCPPLGNWCRYVVIELRMR
jgi:SAM-dependent methyltransferase